MKKRIQTLLRSLLLLGGMLCIILNGFFARVDTTPSGTEYMSVLSSARSTLTQAFSLTALPLAVMNSFTTSPAAAEQPRHPVSGRTTGSTASSDDALTNPAQWMGIAVDGARRHFISAPGVVGIFGYAARLIAGRLSAAPPGAPPFPVFVLLILLCLLPRSGLSDAWGYMRGLGRTSVPVAVARAGFFVARRFQRAVALVTVACFVVTMMPLDGFASLSTPPQPIPPIASDVPGAVAIPAALGTITESHIAGGDRLIVTIQDLHCHAEVQKNIRDIIALLDKECALSAVYLEGASGDVDTSWLGAVKNQRLKHDITDALLAQGTMTGTEAYAVMSGKHGLIKGLEDAALYEANVRRLNSMFSTRADTDAILARMRQQTASLVAVYCGDKNRRLDTLIRKGRSGVVSQKQYHALLRKYARRLGIDVSSYRNLSIYHELMDDSGRIHFARVSDQMGALVTVLKQRLPYSAFNLLLERTDNFRDAEKTVSLLARLSQEYPDAADLARDFPAVAAYVSYVLRGRALNPVMLVREENRIISEIQSRHAASGSERDVVFLRRYLAALDGYFGNKVSADECAFVEEHQQRFRSLWGRYADTSDLNQLEPYLQTVRDFYRVNHQRNSCFIHNMNLDVSSRQKNPSARTGLPAVSVAVMGGFHTDGFTDLLRQRGISYVVITPAVTGDTVRAEKIYRASMEQQALFPVQTMAVRALSENPKDLLNQKVLMAYIAGRLAAHTDVDVINREINDVMKEVLATEGNGTAMNIAVSLDKGSRDRFTFTITANGTPVQCVVKDGVAALVGPAENTAPVSLVSRMRAGLRQIPGARIFRDVIAQPVRELVFFLVPPLFLLAGNPLGFGLAVGLSYVIFSGAHIFRQAPAEQGLSLIQRLRGAGGFKQVVLEYLAFGIPFMVFAGIFSAALPVGLPAAAAVSLASHSVWNMSYLLLESSGRVPRLMRLASMRGSGADSEASSALSSADVNAGLVDDIKRALNARLRDPAWKQATGITNDNVMISIQRRNDAFEVPGHLTAMDIRRHDDADQGVSYQIVLDIHPLLWNVLRDGPVPVGMTRGDIIEMAIGYQTDLWSARNNTESAVYDLFTNYLRTVHPGKDIRRDMRTHEAYTGFFEYMRGLGTAGGGISERFDGQVQYVEFISRLVRANTAEKQDIAYDDVVELVLLHHPSSDVALVTEAHEALKKANTDARAYAHAVRVAWSLAKWGADNETIAAALLNSLEPAVRAGARISADRQRIDAIIARFHRVNALRYVDGVMINRLIGQNALQNYLDLVALSATDPKDHPGDTLSADAMLLTFAEKLWTLDEARTDASEIQRQYLYWEMEQVFVTLAMRINYDAVANDLRDTALRLHAPEQYEKYRESIVLYLGESRAEAEDRFSRKKRSVKQALKGRVSGVRILTRIKGVKSVEEKLTSSRTEHNSFELLSDILGMHIIISDDSLLDDAADAIRSWLRKNDYVYIGQELTTQEDLGFSSLKVNFIDHRQRKYEIRIYTEKEYKKFRFGLMDEQTFNAAIPHWIYKLGPKVTKIMGSFAMQITFMGGRAEEQAFRADNLEYAGEMHQKFNQLRSSLADRMLVQCRFDDGGDRGGGMAVLNLPPDATVADLLSAPEIDGLSAESSLVVHRRAGGTNIVLSLEARLAMGDVVYVTPTRTAVAGDSWPGILARAQTPRARLLALQALEGEKDDSYYAGIMDLGRRWLGAYANDPIMIEILRREFDFTDANELFLAIGYWASLSGSAAVENIPDGFLDAVKKHLLGLTRRVVTVNVSPETITSLAVQQLLASATMARQEDGSTAVSLTERLDHGKIIELVQALLRERLENVSIVTDVGVRHSASGRAPYMFNISLRASDVGAPSSLIDAVVRSVLAGTGVIDVYSVSDLAHYQLLTHDMRDELYALARQYLHMDSEELTVKVKIDKSDQKAPLHAGDLARFEYDPEKKQIVCSVRIGLLDDIIENPGQYHDWARKIAGYKMFEYMALHAPDTDVARSFALYCGQMNIELNAASFHDYMRAPASSGVHDVPEALLRLRNFVVLEDGNIREAAERQGLFGGGPVRAAREAAESVVGRETAKVPDILAGKTVFRYINGEWDGDEAEALVSPVYSSVYVVPRALKDKKYPKEPVGPKLRLTRNGIDVNLDVFSGTIKSARVISVPGLYPHEVPALIQWLKDIPQFFEAGMPFSDLHPLSEDSYLVELRDDDNCGHLVARECPTVIRSWDVAQPAVRGHGWALAIIDEKNVPSASMPERAAALLQAYAAAFALRSGYAVTRPGVIAEAIDIAALSEKDYSHDPGTGELTDIATYIEGAAEAAPDVRLFLLESFTEDDVTRGDRSLIDLTPADLQEVRPLAAAAADVPDAEKGALDKRSVVARKDAVFSNAHALLAEKGARQKSFLSFVAGELTALGRFAPADAREQYVQWLFFTQLRDAVRAARTHDSGVAFRIKIGPGTVDQGLAAIAYWFQAGFDGVRIDIDEATARPDVVRQIQSAVERARPDARIMWSTPVPGMPGMVVQPYDPLRKQVPSTVMVEMGYADLARENADENGVDGAAGLILPAGSSRGLIVGENGRLPRDGDVTAERIREGGTVLSRLARRVSGRQPRTPAEWYRAGMIFGARLTGVAARISPEDRIALISRISPDSMRADAVDAEVSRLSRIIETIALDTTGDQVSAAAAQGWIERLPLESPEYVAAALAGFTRGLLETAAEQQYRTAPNAPALPADPTDRAAMRTLLAIAHAQGLNLEPGRQFNPQTLAHDSAVAPAFEYISRHGQDGAVSAAQLEREVRAIINPLLKELGDTGSLSAANTATIAGLIALIEMFAERNLPSVMESVERSAAPAGKQLAAILSAA